MKTIAARETEATSAGSAPRRSRGLALAAPGQRMAAAALRPPGGAIDAVFGPAKSPIQAKRETGQVDASRPNDTGLPDRLKSGVETLSGLSLDDVRVHRNSVKPAVLNALAYTEGTDIHVAPGQESHLPHEAWHVVQQKQGRVRATLQMKGVAINADGGLEREADLNGAKAAAGNEADTAASLTRDDGPNMTSPSPVVQRAIGYEAEVGGIEVGVVNESTTKLAKGFQIWAGPGYKATADQQVDGSFDLEFVTDPVDDLVAGGRSKAAGVLGAVAAEWAKIQQQPGTFRATKFNTGAVSDVEFSVQKRENNAQLQATAGLSLDALHSILSGSAETSWRNTNSKLNAQTYKNSATSMGGFGKTDKAVWQAVEKAMPGLLKALGLRADHPAKNHLTSIAALLVTPPAASWTDNAADYPKGFAGALLARTDFAAMLDLLPADVRAAIRTNPKVWTMHLLGVVEGIIKPGTNSSQVRKGKNEKGKWHDRPVFNPHSFKGQAPNFGNRLNLGDWYRDLAGGTDRLTAADYRTRYPQRPKAEAEELESLGAFGTKMDASAYHLRKLALLETVSGAALAVAGAIGATGEADPKSGLGMMATGGAMAWHGLSQIAVQRERPVFEFRDLSRVYRDGLVAAGLTLWDFVDQAHVAPFGVKPGSRVWNWVGSKLSGN
jgi:hypothetical protein